MRLPKFRDLEKAIDEGNPVLVSLFDEEHYSVVFGYSRTHFFIFNPSIRPMALGGYGSLYCAVKRPEFRKMWNR